MGVRGMGGEGYRGCGSITVIIKKNSHAPEFLISTKQKQ